MGVVVSTDSDFKANIANNEKVIVKFWAAWCGSCRLMKPKYNALSDKEENAGITFLDVNAEENPDVRKGLGVDNLPYFATFKDGKYIEGVSTSRIEKVEEMIAVLN